MLEGFASVYGDVPLKTSKAQRLGRDLESDIYRIVHALSILGKAR